MLVATSLSVSSGALLAQDAKRGAEISKPCAACHGDDGNSIAPTFPRLAGQHEDYLLHSLRSYRNGGRKNAIMTAQIANLSDQDFRDLSSHYARLKGQLSTMR
ncbi:MAG: cytochrome c [Proteobacteria bacterium]|nr:cytochrome c [Burkholderiales bacterium]